MFRSSLLNVDRNSFVTLAIQHLHRLICASTEVNVDGEVSTVVRNQWVLQVSTYKKLSGLNKHVQLSVPGTTGSANPSCSFWLAKGIMILRSINEISCVKNGNSLLTSGIEEFCDYSKKQFDTAMILTWKVRLVPTTSITGTSKSSTVDTYTKH